MIVLGIESSCDETACAVVKDGRRILSNVIHSQEAMHQPFRGIVPELASRAHLEKMNSVVEQALADAGIKKPDAVAVTTGPGLVGSLLVGKLTAEALAWVWNVPVAGVNHLEAHLYANFFEHSDLEPPFLGLVVSGGHTDLIIVKDYGSYQFLGRTRDDAAGEAFDKASNILKCGYPGGPAIDRLARTGDPDAMPFKEPSLPGTWDFSFSGIKTAVLYAARRRTHGKLSGTRGMNADVSHAPEELSEEFVRDISASFQKAVVGVLVKKTIEAAKSHGLHSIAVGGGVAANSSLRERMAEEGGRHHLNVYFPSLRMCTDNAAMAACVGYYKFKKQAGLGGLNVDPSLRVGDWE